MKYIKLKIKDKTLIIYLNRVEKLNALNSTMIKELDEKFIHVHQLPVASKNFFSYPLNIFVIE